MWNFDSVERAEERGVTAETTHSSSLSSEFDADECGRPDVLITSIEGEWAAESEQKMCASVTLSANIPPLTLRR